MLRIWFESDDLRDFESAGADDHVKLFVPVAGGEPAARDYTPRLFDPPAGRLAIDFAMHGEAGDAGPATAWAMAARVGNAIRIGGPRGSTVVADDFDWYLLIGDETALPSIGRRLEELRPDAKVIVGVSIADEADKLALAPRGGLTVHWCLRSDDGSGDADRLVAAIGGQLPEGDGYVWIGAEATVARTLREHVVETLGHPLPWLKASGYWTLGSAQ